MGQTNKVKIKVLGFHLAYINKDLLNKAMKQEKVYNSNSLITDIIENRYNIIIRSKADIDNLNTLVYRDYYDSIGDFLQEELRQIINPRTKQEEDIGEPQ